MLQSLVLWERCPTLHNLTGGVLEPPLDLECAPLALATNAEAIIGTFNHSQGELFGNRSDVPYQSATKDLELKPILRFHTVGMWRYGVTDTQLMRHTGEPTRRHIETRNLSLGFTEMFHSCLPLEQPHASPTLLGAGHRPRRALPPPPPLLLLCAWRRHIELFSMVSAIFVSTVNVSGWLPGQTNVQTPPRSFPQLLVLGEDPRIFQARGRFYISMQRATEEIGHRYSAMSAEQVFRNFLVDVDTGRTVQLKKPKIGDTCRLVQSSCKNYIALHSKYYASS